MGLAIKDDGWRLSDALWARIEPLLPRRKPHPLGCHNPRVPDRNAMNAILFVLRTGCQWNALNATGICSSNSAHRRFLEWTEAGVFQAFWQEGLLTYDELKGLDWSWLSLDGAMTEAPLAGAEYTRNFNKIFQHPFRDMRCSKTVLATALESMKILKDSKNLLRVTLEWRNGNMQLIASNKDGEEISAEIACDGEPGSCTVNLAYLIDMIKSADEHTPIIHR